MSGSNLTGSARQAVVGVIEPATVTDAAVQTAWIDIEHYTKLLYSVSIGANATSVLPTLLQATDNAGAGAKAIAGKVPTIVLVADKQVLIDIDVQDLDVDNDFQFVELDLLTVDAAIVSALVIGLDADYQPADQFNLASVVEIV